MQYPEMWNTFSLWKSTYCTIAHSSKLQLAEIYLVFTFINFLDTIKYRLETKYFKIFNSNLIQKVVFLRLKNPKLGCYISDLVLHLLLKKLAVILNSSKYFEEKKRFRKNKLWKKVFLLGVEYLHCQLKKKPSGHSRTMEIK